MATERYRRTEGSVSSLHLHFVWCPKYRRPVLGGEVAVTLEALVRERIAALGGEVEALEIMPDHVHLFVAVPPTLAPQHVVAQCKGYTSRVLRERFPWLKRRLPSLWSRAYYVGSLGSRHADRATGLAFIAAQPRS